MKITIIRFVLACGLLAGCSSTNSSNNSPSQSVFGTWTTNDVSNGINYAPSINLVNNSSAIVTMLGQTVNADSVSVVYQDTTEMQLGGTGTIKINDAVVFVEWWANAPNLSYQKWQASFWINSGADSAGGYFGNEGTYSGDPNASSEDVTFYRPK